MKDYDLLPRGIKNLLRASIGRNVVAERWWRLRFSLERAAARNAENSEVNRLVRQLPRLPSAKVAVIIPTYRRPILLANAVRSVLAQTESDLVAMVVDDGGGQLGALPEDPRVVTLSLSRNHHSPGLARNVALRLSRSLVVAFLDDDNTWRPDHLAQALTTLRAGRDLVYTGLSRIRDDGSEFDVLSKDFDRAAHRDQAWVDINAVVMRRVPGVRFDPWARPRWVHPREDWEFVHRMSARLRVQHVPLLTVNYRVHAGSYFTEWGTTVEGTVL